MDGESTLFDQLFRSFKDKHRDSVLTRSHAPAWEQANLECINRVNAKRCSRLFYMSCMQLKKQHPSYTTGQAVVLLQK